MGASFIRHDGISSNTDANNALLATMSFSQPHWPIFFHLIACDLTSGNSFAQPSAFPFGLRMDFAIGNGLGTDFAVSVMPVIGGPTQYSGLGAPSAALTAPDAPHFITNQWSNSFTNLGHTPASTKFAATVGVFVPDDLIDVTGDSNHFYTWNGVATTTTSNFNEFAPLTSHNGGSAVTTWTGNTVAGTMGPYAQFAWSNGLSMWAVAAVSGQRNGSDAAIDFTGGGTLPSWQTIETHKKDEYFTGLGLWVPTDPLNPDYSYSFTLPENTVAGHANLVIYVPFVGPAPKGGSQAIIIG